MRATLLGAGRLLLACVLCQGPVTALFVVGWVMQAMRGAALKVWSREGLADADAPTMEAPARWPSLVLAPGRAPWRAKFTPLWQNFRLGTQGVVNTWALTWPAGLLWYFGWRYGWDISFNKVYETAFFGRTVAWYGIGLFLLAMFYVPVAGARQAATGDWRAFWRVRENLRLAWFTPHFAALALAYAVASIPVMAIIISPYFQRRFNDESLSATALLEALEGYYFATAFVYVPLYVALRLLAARCYAAGLLRALTSGRLAPGELHPGERADLAACGIDLAAFSGRRSAGWAWLSAPVRALLVLGLWFVVVANVFIAQFFNFQPMRHWFNQPMVHLPWVKYVPEHLEATVAASEK